MDELEKLTSYAEDLALHVQALDEEILTECVRLTLSPMYISTDIADLVKVSCNRSGVVVTASYEGVSEARRLFDTVAKYIHSVMDNVPDVGFYLLACCGFSDYPEYEDMVRNWWRFEAMVHSIDDKTMAEWLPLPGDKGESPKFILMATIPDEASFITEEKLAAIIDEQDKLMNPFLVEFNAKMRKGQR